MDHSHTLVRFRLGYGVQSSCQPFESEYGVNEACSTAEYSRSPKVLNELRLHKQLSLHCRLHLIQVKSDLAEVF